jgi:sulfur dioxygenase
MIFRQLFYSTSSTYTYLLASRHGGEALIIDPVLERVDRYIQLLRELDLRLLKAIDTHLHADHITGVEALRERTKCLTVMGEQTKADVVSIRVTDGDRGGIEGLTLDVAYTPGHTDDSYSYLLPDRVFTGDTLLIRGTGRTDFQNGDPRAQYESLFGRLLKLPDETLVYPAHDYKGDTVSTIGEERAFNPPPGHVDRRLRDANEQPQSAQPQDDGRGGPRQHAYRLGAEDRRRSRLGAERGRRQGHVARAGHCPRRPA